MRNLCAAKSWGFTAETRVENQQCSRLICGREKGDAQKRVASAVLDLRVRTPTHILLFGFLDRHADARTGCRASRP